MSQDQESCQWGFTFAGGGGAAGPARSGSPSGAGLFVTREPDTVLFTGASSDRDGGEGPF